MLKSVYIFVIIYYNFRKGDDIMKKNKKKNFKKIIGVVGLTTLGATLCGCNHFEDVNYTLYGPPIPPSEEIDIRFNPEDNLIEPMYGTIQDRELNTIEKIANIEDENQENSKKQ